MRELNVARQGSVQDGVKVFLALTYNLISTLIYKPWQYSLPANGVAVYVHLHSIR